MNLVMISPHFPPNYYQFATGAKQAGLNVLAIGDTPYETLRRELQEALTEYYRVDNLGLYDDVMRGVAYFVHKYGRITCLESHNEYWLEQDATLREDFNIPGLRPRDVEQIKHKSAMRRIFEDADIGIAPGVLTTSLKAARRFADTVGYPLVAKPDVGVGASKTYKLMHDQDLERFFDEKPPIPYLLEAYIDGILHSFDGLTDSEGQIVFCTGHMYVPGIMDVVNEDTDVYACSFRELPQGLENNGRRTVEAFNVRARFFHVEFILDTAGRWIALEMNMRPPGGLMLDVFNFANDIDIYHQWANVAAYQTITEPFVRPYHCAFVGRKHHIQHRHSHEDILRNYGRLVIHNEPIPPVFARAMGNHAYLVRSPKMADVQKVIDYILETNQT